MRVLLVEDERRMAEAIGQVLKKNNYSVDLAHDGEYGLDCALSGIYDMIVLDIMLPKLDGISLLMELRQHRIFTPVILLTAKGETEDKVRGLDSGADDYLAKPFQTEELLARMRALGRRQGELLHENILRYGDIELNPHTLDLKCREKSFRLTLKEAQLLELLLKHSGMILPTATIIEKLWGFETDTEDRHVQVYVSFLRKKLVQLESAVKIKSVRGKGYVLAVAGVGINDV
ncbi:DNA-binding response regulator, OmpR family, contains REC and winged-helix (wHTH) domain [Evansella caseinilytica]|uniref:DNA-binding response regulator, OmpR family, contains REC and winged-helix (WHTH) domain n=1 Tax=Evansella caseinilytica TaxID=1503961 RepID=A0A1H3Q677_9BACI|nr:response regulator transcription factor [Evansella caseinilytica]SDZ08199.1 DNA-binding response regulator, OmpR family, contains REC and winged-helix (wHTH) domain [Evansella caseinilytica]